MRSRLASETFPQMFSQLIVRVRLEVICLFLNLKKKLLNSCEWTECNPLWEFLNLNQSKYYRFQLNVHRITAVSHKNYQMIKEK